MTVTEVNEMIFCMINCDKSKVLKMDIKELDERISDLENAILYLDKCNKLHYDFFGEDDELAEGILKKIAVQKTLNYFKEVYDSKKIEGGI